MKIAVLGKRVRFILTDKPATFSLLKLNALLQCWAAFEISKFWETAMKKITLCIVLFCALAACSEDSDHKPSPGAQGLPGARGTLEFKPEDWTSGATTWWKDTDGVDPGIAGCHIGTESDGSPNGRMFGEACLTDGLLVESNPGAGELHSHSDDIGHPDKFDCNAWCVGNDFSKGRCESAAAPPCARSARCECE